MGIFINIILICHIDARAVRQDSGIAVCPECRRIHIHKVRVHRDFERVGCRTLSADGGIGSVSHAGRRCLDGAAHVLHGQLELFFCSRTAGGRKSFSSDRPVGKTLDLARTVIIGYAHIAEGGIAACAVELDICIDRFAAQIGIPGLSIQRKTGGISGVFHGNRALRAVYRYGIRPVSKGDSVRKGKGKICLSSGIGLFQAEILPGIDFHGISCFDSGLCASFRRAAVFAGIDIPAAFQCGNIARIGIALCLHFIELAPVYGIGGGIGKGAGSDISDCISTIIKAALSEGHIFRTICGASPDSDAAGLHGGVPGSNAGKTGEVFGKSHLKRATLRNNADISGSKGGRIGHTAPDRQRFSQLLINDGSCIPFKMKPLIGCFLDCLLCRPGELSVVYGILFLCAVRHIRHFLTVGIKTFLCDISPAAYCHAITSDDGLILSFAGSHFRKDRLFTHVDVKTVACGILFDADILSGYVPGKVGDAAFHAEGFSQLSGYGAAVISCKGKTFIRQFRLCLIHIADIGCVGFRRAAACDASHLRASHVNGMFSVRIRGKRHRRPSIGNGGNPGKIFGKSHGEHISCCRGPDIAVACHGHGAAQFLDIGRAVILRLEGESFFCNIGGRRHAFIDIGFCLFRQIHTHHIAGAVQLCHDAGAARAGAVGGANNGNLSIIGYRLITVAIGHLPAIGAVCNRLIQLAFVHGIGRFHTGGYVGDLGAAYIEGGFVPGGGGGQFRRSRPFADGDALCSEVIGGGNGNAGRITRKGNILSHLEIGDIFAFLPCQRLRRITFHRRLNALEGRIGFAKAGCAGCVQAICHGGSASVTGSGNSGRGSRAIGKVHGAAMLHIVHPGAIALGCPGSSLHGGLHIIDVGRIGAGGPAACHIGNDIPSVGKAGSGQFHIF